jgi:hypothetical protein
MPRQLRIRPYVPIRHLIVNRNLTYSQMTERSHTSGYSSRQTQAPSTSSFSRYEGSYATSTNAGSHSYTRPSGPEASGVPASADLAKELAIALHAIAERDKDNENLRTVISLLNEDVGRAQAGWDAEMQKVENLQKNVESLIQERDEAAAQQLEVNTFDSSLDRVSEGQLVSEIEALNNSISGLVMDALEKSGPMPGERPTPEALEFVRKEPLLVLASRERTSGDSRELLVEAALHRTIIHYLYPVLFLPQVAPKIPFAKRFEELYVKEICEKGQSRSVVLHIQP